MSRCLFAVLFSLLIISCTEIKKAEEIVIPGNKALPDTTREVNNYINHTYISLLGRKASASEESWAYQLLRDKNMSKTARAQFVDTILSKQEYRNNLYTLARIELLGNMDTSEIPFRMYLDSLALKDTSLKLFYDQLQQDLVKLDSMRRIPSDLQKNMLHISKLHSRCVNNYFYDQINMGSENFVVSCFQHFLSRYPTAYELEESKKMVDGAPGILFLQAGQTKGDFLNIFFTSQDYYEGLVRNLYNRYLYRKPNSVEMSEASLKFTQTFNYEQMQKDILITDEYAGVK